MSMSSVCKLVLNMCSCSFLPFTMEEMEDFKKKYFGKIMSKTHQASNGQCMLWTGTKKKGTSYGVICCFWQGKFRTFSVHRLVFVFHNGLHIDDITQSGMDVSHLCHNTLCVNPQHLSYEPHQTNTVRRACISAGTCTGHFGLHAACLLHLKL